MGKRIPVIFWWPSASSMTSSPETIAWVHPCSLELAGWGLSDERLISPHSFSVALGPFVEELFEVTSCYFPIDFTPVSSTFHSFTHSNICPMSVMCQAQF